MSKITKAYAICDAKISFVSLVDKAANKKQFLITKEENGTANFTSFGRIIKADENSHFVTGIVYEPLVEDSQGNYMTEEEITKAAYWFAKNANNVDIQHCFEKCAGAAVVESYVSKCDMNMEGEIVKKGTWLMTVEISDNLVWDSIQKGDITGFSMGGFGIYSEDNVTLEDVTKAEEPKGLLKKLAKAFGYDVVEKGAVKSNFTRRIKEENFYSAWYALRSTLEGNFYNAETGLWEYGYNADETTIKDALTDFNDIVTQVLTSDLSIVKSLEKAAKEAPRAIEKAGKSLSTKNLEALQSINSSLTEFLSSFADANKEESEETEGDKSIKKEINEMKLEEVQKMVEDTVAKSLEPVTKALKEMEKAEEMTSEMKQEDIVKMIGEEVAKAIEPVTKALEPLMRSRALPGNLNGVTSEITKSEESHYMTGMF